MSPFGATASPELPYAGLALSEVQFRRIGELVTGISGIQLPPGKENLVRSRLAKRLRALQLTTVQEYLDLVDRDSSDAELDEMVDVLTTNKTSFFRESEHFRLLQRHVLPSLARGDAPIRVWSAGCATGEEPYSVAMVARDSLGATAARVRILATDISARVLQRARAGEYDSAAVRDLAPDVRQRHLQPVTGVPGRERICAATRALVEFERLNLMDPWPMKDPFDVILCRNVMIYFDKFTQERLVARFTAMLAPGGHLLLGHAECLSGLRHELAYVQPATFRR